MTHPDLVVPGTGLDIILTRTLSTYNAHYMETGNMEDYYNAANYDSSGLGWHLARDFGFFVTSYLDPSKCTPVNKLYGEDIPLIEQDEDRNYLSARETAFDNPFMLSVTAGARSFYATSPELSSQIPYPLVSKDSWVAFCVPSRYPEEANIEIGIKVKSPDGKTYTFDWAGTGKNVAKAARDSGQGEYSGIWLTSGSYITADGKNRESDVLYLTRIEDKFGNYLSFHYTNMATNDWDDNALLDKITASDGREVIIEYRDWNTIFPVLTDIKVNSPAGNQTIHYEYQTVSNQKGHRHDLLTKVTTSEGLTWQYDYYLDNPLARDRRISAAYLPRKVTTPYGATIEYTYQSVNLPGIPGHLDCYPATCDPEITFEGIAIQSQTLSGPGINPAVWTYNFGAIEDYDATTVIDPYKNKTVYKHCGLRAVDKIPSCTAREGTIVSKQYLA